MKHHRSSQCHKAKEADNSVYHQQIVGLDDVLELEKGIKECRRVSKRKRSRLDRQR